MTERLEEIKTRFNAMKELESFKKLAPTDLFFDDYDWLIQQAELAVGLEHELEAADKQEEQWEEIISTTMHWKSIYEKEAQRYKQALEFYADEENYKPFDGIFLSSYQNKVDEDGGKKARQALEREGRA